MASALVSKTERGSILDKEQENFIRLLMISAEKGTDVFRKTLFLFTTTKCNVTTFKEVLPIAELHKRKITPSFVQKFLWPTPDPTKPVDPIDDVNQMDITACNALLNLIDISDLTDGNHEFLKEALGKIKEFRNKLCHSTDQRCEDASFNQLFEDIRQVFQDIARIKPQLEVPDDEVLKYKTLPVTLESYRQVKLVVKEVLSETSSLREDLKITNKSVGNLHMDMTKQNEDLKIMMMEEKKKYDEKIKNLEQMLADIEKKIKTMEDGKYQKLDERMKKLEIQKEEEKVNDKQEIKKVLYDGFRKKYFVGRDKEMSILVDQFGVDKAVTHFVGVAICGTGGYGKTALASEYAKKYHGFYKGGVLWFDCDNAHVVNSIRRVSNKLDLGGGDVVECQDKIVQWILKSTEPVLIVADNFDEEPVSTALDVLLNGSWREMFNGHMLVTTRRHRTQIHEKYDFAENCCWQLDEMKPDDACKLLLYHSQYIISVNTEAEKNAEIVCKELGFLPLAIEQSGMYIKAMKQNEERDVFEQYLDQFRNKKEKLLVTLEGRFKAKPISDEYNRERLTIQTTWRINFEHIWKTNSAAGYMMIVLSYLGLQDIPCCLLETNPPRLINKLLHRYLQEESQSALKVNGLLHSLTEYSLFYHDEENCSLSIHPLVQQMIRQSVEGEERRYGLFFDALSLLKDALDKVKYRPTTIFDAHSAGKSIEEMPSIFTWNQLVHHGEILISTIKEQFLLDKMNRKYIPMIYNQYTCALMYEISVQKCIYGLGQEMIAYRNEAVRVAYHSRADMPFWNPETFQEVPFPSAINRFLKTCLLSPADRSKIFDDRIKDSDTANISTDFCFVASDSESMISKQSEIGDAYYHMAKSRCAAARSVVLGIKEKQGKTDVNAYLQSTLTLKEQVDIQSQHDKGCQCLDILSKDIQMKFGESVEEVPPFTVRQGFDILGPTDSRTILVLDDGTYDLSAFPQGTLENVMLIGTNTTTCKLISSEKWVYIKGIVHFENVTIACKGALYAEKNAKVSFAQCSFRQPSEAVALPNNFPKRLFNNLRSRSTLSKKKEHLFINMQDLHIFLYGYEADINIHDSESHSVSNFLALDQCNCVIRSSKISGCQAGNGVMADRGSLIISDTAIDSFDIATVAHEHAHLVRCNFHHNMSVLIFWKFEQNESSKALPKGSSKETDISVQSCQINDNGNGAFIFGTFSIALTNNEFSRQAEDGLLVLCCLGNEAGDMEPTICSGTLANNTFEKNGGVGLCLVDGNKGIEVHSNNTNGNEMINLGFGRSGWIDCFTQETLNQDIYKFMQVHPPIQDKLKSILSKDAKEGIFCTIVTRYMEVCKMLNFPLKDKAIPQSIEEEDETMLFNIFCELFFKDIDLTWNTLSEHGKEWIRFSLKQIHFFVVGIAHGIYPSLNSLECLVLAKKIPVTSDATIALKESVVIIEHYCNLVEEVYGKMHFVKHENKLIERVNEIVHENITPHFHIGLSSNDITGLVDNWVQFCPNCGTVIVISNAVKCGNCRVIKYCSKDCENKDFDIHQRVCFAIMTEYSLCVEDIFKAPVAKFVNLSLEGYYASNIDDPAEYSAIKMANLSSKT